LGIKQDAKPVETNAQEMGLVNVEGQEIFIPDGRRRR